jgi:IS30 family transposase
VISFKILGNLKYCANSQTKCNLVNCLVNNKSKWPAEDLRSNFSRVLENLRGELILGYFHLTTEGRCQIYTLKSIGKTQKEIAEYLGVSASTISRELQRNSGKKGYRYKQANDKAMERRYQASLRPKKLFRSTLNLVEEKLFERWSPEQIAGVLRASDIEISHESIYRHIWADKKLGGKLYQFLRRRGKKYNHRSSKTAGRGCIPNRIDIQQRPKIVEKKSRLGDWEGDTLIGAKQQGVILSL